MEHEIQEVRMGSQYIVAIADHYIAIVGDEAILFTKAGKAVKELWLGPGAFIVYKES